MTEEEAQQMLRSRFDVSRETFAKLENYVSLLKEASGQQNLIAASTLDQVWARHILDSAQLLFHVKQTGGIWIDLGSGAGLPGIVIAILSEFRVVMIEMRRKRVAFLSDVITQLGLNAEAVLTKAENYRPPGPAAVVSARAYAPLERILASAAHLATRKSQWVLHKGQSFQNELANATRLWQGDFRVESSCTSPDSAIVVISNLRGTGARR